MSSYEMKYVVTSCEETGEQIFIFPKDIDRDVFANVLSYIKHGDVRWTRPFRKPISAGFTDGTHCYGYSDTLKLRSRECDAALIANGSYKTSRRF